MGLWFIPYRMRGYSIPHPPGEVLVTDKSCYNSGDGYCTFYDADALDMDDPLGVVTEDEYICPGCNETVTRSDVDAAPREEVDALREAAA